jgi:hypothetical protein
MHLGNAFIIDKWVTPMISCRGGDCGLSAHKVNHYKWYSSIFGLVDSRTVSRVSVDTIDSIKRK